MFEYIIQQEPTSNNTSNMMPSSELFKLYYFDNQRWTLQTNQDRSHQRHFSANDRRVRNLTYSPSSSSLQQQLSIVNPMYNAIPSEVKSENIIEFDKQQQR
jgi:hypothetical protein